MIIYIDIVGVYPRLFDLAEWDEAPTPPRQARQARQARQGGSWGNVGCGLFNPKTGREFEIVGWYGDDLVGMTWLVWRWIVCLNINQEQLV